MKKTVLLLAIAFILVSCGSRHRQSDEIVVKVDSIACADTIIGHHPLEIQLFGTVGIDSCCSFSRVYENIDSIRTQLMVLAKPVPMPRAKGDTIELNLKHKIKPQSADSVVIEVINPGFAKKLSKTVIISKE